MSDDWLVQQAQLKIQELKRHGGGFIGLASVWRSSSSSTSPWSGNGKPVPRVFGALAMCCVRDGVVAP